MSSAPVRTTRGLSLSALFLGLVAMAIDGCDTPKKQDIGATTIDGTTMSITPDGRDLRRTPPKIRTMTARKLGDRQAVLEVRFEPTEKLPRRITIQPHDVPVVLNDEGADGDEKAGDGTFSGRMAFDVRDLESAQKKAAAVQATTEFEGRSVRRVRREFLPVDFKRFEIGERIPLGPLPVDPSQIDVARSLMITHTSVVEDPARTSNPCGAGGMGKWTFGHLMTEMANQPLTGIDPSDFVRRWLMNWEFDQVVNFWQVPKRPSIKQLIIDPWDQASGGTGKLDLAKAPFRLLAIVNRIDLADNLVYGGGSAGEGRFVFCAVDLNNNCAPLQFTVIFEYGIKKKTCGALKAWAQQWQDLSMHSIGSAAYNSALELITEQFAKAGADPAKPNGSALNQLRTNEIALGFPWELREFQVLSSLGGHLGQVTVKQTPDISLNNTGALTNWVNANASDVVDCKAVVPLLVPPSAPFLGGASPVPSPSFFWNNPAPPATAIAPREARHQFSLKTCNACHGGETATAFTHIKPAPFGTAAPLSGFLTGINVPDPADGGVPVRTFNDLLNRQQRMAEILNSPCLLLMFRAPLRFVH